MPRTARAIEAGAVYHALNRGNGRMHLFRKDGDYIAFERVMAEGLDRYSVDMFTYCLMPNHWHMVVRPRTDEALGQFMGWVGVTHVRRHHEHYHERGMGHLYQGRFKTFPVAEDDYFLTLCRYVEANPLRANLIRYAWEWPWSGLWGREHDDKDVPLTAWPVTRPLKWRALVQECFSTEQLRVVRECVARGRPLGNPAWVRSTAERLGLEFTLHGPGRPRKSINQ